MVTVLYGNYICSFYKVLYSGLLLLLFVCLCEKQDVYSNKQSIRDRDINCVLLHLAPSFPALALVGLIWCSKVG